MASDEALVGRPAPQATLRRTTSVGRNAVYLQPGELCAHRTPWTVLTIVGSCVAVCIYDPSTSVGGATHYLLPQDLTPDGAMRYGVAAIPKLVNDLVALGARPDHLAAKVFGGARMIASERPEAGGLGAQNVDLAYRLLRDLGVPVVASDVRGTQARRIVFRTDDGAVWLRRL